MTWFTNKILFHSILGLSFFFFTGRWFLWFRSIDNNPVKMVEPVKKKLSVEEEYKESALRRFLASYREAGCAKKYNANIESVFYLGGLSYSEAIKETDNELEKTWRRRILMEPTPRGNIVMFYDAFKRAFSYYSDTSMPYSFLNAVCMKYVLVYRCRDFFIDQYVIPNAIPLGGELLGVSDSDKNDKKVAIKGPYLKLKNVPVSNNKKPLAMDLMKNKIIRVGGFSSFQPCNKEKEKPPVLCINKENESVVVKSYSDFKQWRTPKIDMFD